jgi:hypothetical protein
MTDWINKLRVMLKAGGFKGHAGIPGHKGASLKRAVASGPQTQKVASPAATAGATVSGYAPALAPIGMIMGHPYRMASTTPVLVQGANGKAALQVTSLGTGPLKPLQAIVSRLNGSTGGISYSVVQSYDDREMYHLVKKSEYEQQEALRNGDAVGYLKALRQGNLAKRLGPKIVRRIRTSRQGFLVFSLDSN